MKHQKTLLIINGSPSGSRGNCAKLISHYKNLSAFKCRIIHLAKEPRLSSSFRKSLLSADACLFVSGTYWDSWGSPLQKFIEDLTPLEGHPLLVGKPAGVAVLMHSVGGKEVLSRLQGVLNTFGFLIPPMSGFTYSLVSEIALKSKSTHQKDFWSLDDLQIIDENLLKATALNVKWSQWPVDKKDPRRLWLK